MMYLHYCHRCNRIHILSGHKTICPACDHTLKELRLSFYEYENLGAGERALYLERCQKASHS